MGLTQLKPPTKSQAKQSLISGLTSSGRGRFLLIKPGNPYKHGRGSYIITPEGKLANGKAFSRLLKSFPTTTDMDWINNDLKAITSFPFVEAALGLIPGGGAGYSVVNTAVGQFGPQHAGVLVRLHDKIIEVEQIGIYKGKTTHVAYFYVVDPFRKTSRGTGMAWLFHEERHEVTAS